MEIMGKLNCICGYEYSDTTESTWPALYLLTEKQLSKLCCANKAIADEDIESRDVLKCPKCNVLAIQITPESVIYNFYRHIPIF